MVPKRSAIMPPSGWPMPHSRFCKASANANTSRPQWLAFDSGVRKKPIVERGPNAISVIRQPMPITSAGVRQVAAAALDWIGLSRSSLVVIAAPISREFRKAAQYRAAGLISQTKSTPRRTVQCMAGPRRGAGFAMVRDTRYGFLLLTQFWVTSANVAFLLRRLRLAARS